MMHYGLVDIAVRQEIRDKLRERKAAKSYSQLILELLEKWKQNGGVDEIESKTPLFSFPEGCGQF